MQFPNEQFVYTTHLSSAINSVNTELLYKIPWFQCVLETKEFYTRVHSLPLSVLLILQW